MAKRRKGHNPGRTYGATYYEWLTSQGDFKEKHGPLRASTAVISTRFVRSEDGISLWRILTKKGWYEVMLYTSAAISFKVYDDKPHVME